MEEIKREIDKYSKEALDFWGFDPQSLMLLEEMGELTKAICKYRRFGCEQTNVEIKNNLLEEIADVHNMIDQMELYFGKEEITKIRLNKLKRTHERIKIQKGGE